MLHELVLLYLDFSSTKSSEKIRKIVVCNCGQWGTEHSNYNDNLIMAQHLKHHIIITEPRGSDASHKIIIL